MVAATSVMIVRLDNDETQNPDAESSAAEKFAEAIRSDEGSEGTLAFMQKRPASWAASE